MVVIISNGYVKVNISKLLKKEANVASSAILIQNAWARLLMLKRLID